VPAEPGVYEVKHRGASELLTIGGTSDLRRRIERELVKGKGPHSTRNRILSHEDISKVVVRWATTDRPAAVEEELHRKYKAKFGRPPKYVKYARGVFSTGL
jgi:hypothetical protein